MIRFYYNLVPNPTKVALKERHAFKTELDDEARRYLFPQNVAPAA